MKRAGALLPFALLFSGPLLAKTCDVKTLTNNCELFRQLEPNDTLEFDDGTQVPACALNSMSQGDEEKRAKDLQRPLAVFGEVLGNSELSGVTDDQRKRWMNGELRMDDLLPQEARKIRWPPGGGPGDSFQRVTPEQVRAFWENKVGKDNYLKLVSAATEHDEITRRYIDRRMAPSSVEFDFSKQSAREERLFVEAKSAVERKILAGRSEFALNANEKEILARIRGVKLRKGNLDQFECGIPYGASFDYGVQEVSIPPGLMFQPDEALLRVMTHEISHSFDLCRLGGGLDGDSAAPKYPRASGDLAHTPFFETYRCLRSTGGGAFRGPEEKSNDPDTANACHPNHHNEAFCDWFAAETMATEMKMKGRPTNGPMPKPLRAASGKTVKLPSALKPHLLQLDYACNTGEKERYQETGQHPSWANRVDKLMMRQPALTQGLGCTASGKACPYPTVNTRSDSVAPATQPAPGSQTQGID